MQEGIATLSALAEAGFSKNTTGIVGVTKRDGQWIETSVEDFRDAVRHLALGLYDLGVRHGDRVALHAENSTEWLVVDQAVLALGAVAVPIYTTQPGDQIRYILENSEARVYVVSTEALFAALRPFVDRIPTLEATVGLRGTFHDAMLSFEQVIERGCEKEAAAPDLFGRLRAAVQPDDLATFVYTSGTTGLPKGVMLTHRNLVSNALAAQERFPFDVEQGRGGTVLSYLPLSHVLERMTTFVYLHIGYPIYFVENFQEIMDDFRVVRPVHFSTVPRLLEKIHAGIQARAEAGSGPKQALLRWALGLAGGYDVERPMGRLDRLRFALADLLVFRKLRGLFGGRLKAVTSGGAALPGRIMNFFNAVGIFCGQGYGMTEASPVISVYKKGALRAGSAGLPLPGVAVRIADDGEILARGPNVMRGYYKLPDETARVLTDDGWLQTGDIGHLDADGHLFITDRKKELLKLSTGKYVAPAPIEAALGASPFVEQAVVIGNDCKFCAALIVPDAEAARAHLEADAPPGGLAALIQAAVDDVNAGLPPWEQVKRFRLLEAPFTVEGGELTPTLKVKRRVVQQKYRREIEAMYAA